MRGVRFISNLSPPALSISTRLISTLLISALLISVCLLSACSPAPSDTLNDYLARLTRALDVSVSDIAKYQNQKHGVHVNAALLSTPSRRTLLLETPQQSLDILEFLRLSNCELGRVIGQQNSSLGRMAATSQTMHLQRDLLLSAPECEARLVKENPELSQRVISMMRIKSEARMAYWWNAWFAGLEWSAFNDLTGEPLALVLPDTNRDLDDTTPAQATEAAITSLSYAINQGEAWSAKHYQYDSGQMEQHLQQLLASEAIGRWRLSQQLLTQLSQQAGDLINLRLGSRPLCPAQRKTPQAEIVQNVFYKYYAGVVQPYLSKSERFADRLMPLLERAGAMAQPVDDYFQWLTQIQRERDALQQAHQYHVEQWQALLTQCAMMPAGER
ncbi:MAG: DUF3080 family protein [Oleibacter sp.]|nr:DUF3080 family protein [Thalassolituus sp.]